MSHGAEDIQAHVRTYLMVFAALAGLTIATVAASYLSLPLAPAIALALVIAAIKASLVALFFMHLKGEVKMIYWALLLTAIFFVVLMALPLSGFSDSTSINPSSWSVGH